MNAQRTSLRRPIWVRWVAGGAAVTLMTTLTVVLAQQAPPAHSAASAPADAASQSAMGAIRAAAAASAPAVSASDAVGTALAQPPAATASAVLPPMRVPVVQPATAAAADPLVAKGRYLAQTGDCVSCHTAVGGKPFAGGLAMGTPFGTIVSTNITPDQNAGIGAYTQEEFNRAVREGVAKDGHRLYPAMPYTSFAAITDEDMQALYAYFTQGVDPVDTRPAATDLPWPFSMRWLMVFWNWLYADQKPYEAVAAQSAEWNRGAYLVRGLGHCGECHTPRGRLGGPLATGEGSAAFLSGSQVDGWLAQALRHGDVPTAAQWPQKDWVQYLKTGRTEHTAAFGPMVQVVENSTQHMTPEDLAAIGTYIRSLGAPAAAAAAQTSPMALAASQAASSPAAAALRDGKPSQAHAGALVYLNNCNACHTSSGAGASKTFPTLAGNPVVLASDPTSLIRIVLSGSQMAATAGAPSAIAMPALGWRLNDEEVAKVLSFARSSWGNQAAAVTPAQVAAVRATLAPAAAKGNPP